MRPDPGIGDNRVGLTEIDLRRARWPCEFAEHLADHPMRQRLLVPACRSCSAILDTRFEKPAKETVRRLAPNYWVGEAETHERAAVGLWSAKILLLATHPLALHQHPKINKHRTVGDWETKDFSWRIDGAPPPGALSLWALHAE